MKKIIFILIVVFAPIMVFADSVSPGILGYDAVITKKGGATDYYSDDRKIPYNSKIVVYDEYDDRALGCFKNNIDDCFEVRLVNIAPLKKEVVPNDLIKKDNRGTTLKKVDTKVFIYDKKGIKLKKGPADVYGTYDTVVPFKEELKATHVIRYEGHGGGYTWYYIDDENYRGWYHGANMAVYSNLPMMTFDNVKFYNIDTDEVIETIPVGTVFEEYYSSSKAYLTYKDQFGYIIRSDDDDYYFYSYSKSLGFKSKLGYLLTGKSIEIKVDGKAITAVPKGEKIKILYASMEDDEAVDSDRHYTTSVCVTDDNCLYYVEYNNVQGFVKDENVVSLRHEGEEKTTSYPEDLKLYDVDLYLNSFDELYNKKRPIEEFSKEHETDDIIPANTNVRFYMDESIVDYSKESDYGSYRYDIHLVKYNNKVGWIINEIVDDREYYNTGNDDNSNIETNDDTNTNKSFVMSKSMETIISAIMGALIVSSLGLIILFLVNKKKKPKEIKPVLDNNIQDEIIPVKKIDNDNKNEG